MTRKKNVTKKKVTIKKSSSRKQTRKNIKKRLSTVSKQQQKQKEQLLEQLERIPIIENAIKKVGISRSTYYRWRDEDKEFSKDSEKSRSVGIEYISEIAESKLIQKIQGGNSAMIRFWLSKNVKRYGGKNTLEIILADDSLDELQEKILSQAVNRWKQKRVKVKAEPEEKKK